MINCVGESNPKHMQVVKWKLRLVDLVYLSQFRCPVCWLTLDNALAKRPLSLDDMKTS